MSLNIDWNDVIKKETRGLKDDDLGEVQEIRGDTIITKTGIVVKETYAIPKNFVTRYDGHNLWFHITKDEAKSQYKIEINKRNCYKYSNSLILIFYVCINYL